MIDPVSVSTASATAVIIERNSQAIAVRLTSSRSISVPTKSPKSVTGKSCASASAPTATAECVSWMTSHEAAICCIQVPVNETAWPAR